MTYRGLMRRWLSPVIALGVLTGLLSVPIAADAQPAAEQLTWTDCADLECAWVTVPLEYAMPTRETIRIRISRSPAPAATRIGSLLVNPGGPGASGLSYAGYLASSMPRSVTDRYDIIGFDPRGVGKSAPVECLNDRALTTYVDLDFTPDTKAERSALVKAAKRFTAGCETRSPTIVGQLNTDATARDMDAIRAALGEQTMNFLGFSYGTSLGARYAHLFPSRVGRMVLDAAVDPSLDVMGISKGQSDGFQVALRRFTKDCLKRTSCPLSGSTNQALRSINAFLERLDKRPIPANPGQPLLQTQAINAIFGSLYATWQWPSLRDGLRDAMRRNDGTLLQDTALAGFDRTTNGRFTSNFYTAFISIACSDSPAAPGISGLRKAATNWASGTKVPLLAEAMAWSNVQCSQWPYSAPLQPVSAKDAAPIVVIGTKYDPATPEKWAAALASQLHSGVLVTYNGDGHTAYLSGSKCIDSIVNNYLAQGDVPANPTACN